MPINRRNVTMKKPTVQRSGYDPSAAKVEATKKFNEQVRVIQGFRYSIAQGQTPQTPMLNVPGRQLIGISIIPVTAADISDIAVDFTVNGFNLLSGNNAAGMNPIQIPAMVFYALPQILQGNDSIKVNFNKQNAGTITLYLNIYYLPQ